MRPRGPGHPPRCSHTSSAHTGKWAEQARQAPGPFPAPAPLSLPCRPPPALTWRPPVSHSLLQSKQTSHRVTHGHPRRWGAHGGWGKHWGPSLSPSAQGLPHNLGPCLLPTGRSPQEGAPRPTRGVQPRRACRPLVCSVGDTPLWSPSRDLELVFPCAEGTLSHGQDTPGAIVTGPLPPQPPAREQPGGGGVSSQLLPEALSLGVGWSSPPAAGPLPGFLRTCRATPTAALPSTLIPMGLSWGPRQGGGSAGQGQGGECAGETKDKAALRPLPPPPAERGPCLWGWCGWGDTGVSGRRQSGAPTGRAAGGNAGLCAGCARRPAPDVLR